MMQRRHLTWLALIPALAIVLLLAMTALLANNRAAAEAAPSVPDFGESIQMSGNLDRPEDVVIVTGDRLPAFEGIAFDQLFVYAYTHGVWKQVPWQFDEVAGGHITTTEDSLLDADDQLLFMASDVGDQASKEAWIGDVGSRQHPRYEIMVSDPLRPSKKGWVYVYWSTTDTDTVTTDYVDYDRATWLFTTPRYILGTVPNRMIADRLEMNGSGVDILDRTKFRVSIPDFSLLLTENEVSLAYPPAVRDGRVRAFVTLSEGPSELTLIGYRSRYEFVFDLDFSPWVTAVDWVRLSADLNPSAIGSTYYDANTIAGVPVDGQADSVTASPPTDWWQISGNTGTVVQIADLSQLGITRTNYYKDDQTIDPADTGDHRSYADCGAYVEKVNPHMVFHLWYYILPANQASVGSTYQDAVQHPLQITVSEQQYGSNGGWGIYLPAVMHP